jgi:acyl-coenzyme A thioesterase PaaI-like protein
MQERDLVTVAERHGMEHVAVATSALSAKYGHRASKRTPPSLSVRLRVVHSGVYVTVIESAASIGEQSGGGAWASGRWIDQHHPFSAVTDEREIARLKRSRCTKEVAINCGRVDVTDEQGRPIAHGELRLQRPRDANLGTAR